MLFNTPLFFCFFALFYLLYQFVFTGRTGRLVLILTSSLIFYAGWNYRFVPLLIFSAVSDYLLARWIFDSNDPARRKLLFTASVGINLGILGLFKYSGFAIESTSTFLRAMGLSVSTPTLEFVLPVGISFYTFQSLSYTFDVYRGKITAHESLLEFTSALAFFPQLVAGPILRAREILPQLERMPVASWNESKRGMLLFSIGLFKKTVADLLALRVEAVFDTDAPLSAFETWTGVLAFAGQIYGDFSGYTDMAIGLALLLGFKFPENFHLPYYALSPVEFWRRWHITLSTWLRDYLYISLGGNRHGHYRNLFVTMALCGLWHGAAWTYIVWGVFHGVVLIATHALATLSWFRSFQGPTHPGIAIVKWGITFYLVLVGWVFFRSDTVAAAFDMLGTLHGMAPSVASGEFAGAYALAATTALLAMHSIDHLFLRWGSVIERRGALVWPLVLSLQFACFVIGAPSEAFIYFQF